MGLIKYIQATRAEMKHVVWLSRKDIGTFTAVVIVIAFAVAYYLGLFDLIFTKLLELAI